MPRDFNFKIKEGWWKCRCWRREPT